MKFRKNLSIYNIAIISNLLPARIKKREYYKFQIISAGNMDDNIFMNSEHLSDQWTANSVC